MGSKYITANDILEYNDWKLQDLIEWLHSSSGIIPVHPHELKRMIHISGLPKKSRLDNIIEAGRWVTENWGVYSKRKAQGPDCELYRIINEILDDGVAFEKYMSSDDESLSLSDTDLRKLVGVKASYVPDGYIMFKNYEDLIGFVFIKNEIKELSPEVLVDPVEIESDPEEGLREYESFCLRIDELHDVKPINKKRLKALVYKRYRRGKTNLELAKDLSLSASLKEATLKRYATRYCSDGRIFLNSLDEDTQSYIGLGATLENNDVHE